MSFKIEINDNGKWIGNAVRLATRGEADSYANYLHSRWTLIDRPRVVESDDPANYEIDKCALVSMEKTL